ncbi:MAG: hypothetical protein OXT09_17605 [Myxococcales bacterium]|nr:hypothetical protein [Myxococcales bacterium]
MAYARSTWAVPGDEEELGHFGRSGFFHAGLRYSVRYLHAPQKQLMSANWILDNFYEDKRGKTRPKTSSDYITTIAFDTDGDGKTDLKEIVPKYDLRFLNRHTSAVVWHSTFPLSQTLADTELSLRGELAGTDEEGCVRHVAGGMTPPSGAGSLIHIVRR